jgi:hypothetical protein
METSPFRTLAQAEQAVSLLRTFAPRAEVAVGERPGVPFAVRFASDYADGWFASWEHVAMFLVAFCPPGASAGPRLEALPEAP